MASRTCLSLLVAASLALAGCEDGNLGDGRDGSVRRDGSPARDFGGEDPPDMHRPVDLGPPLPCDDAFAIEGAPTEGTPLVVRTTDDEELAYVGLATTGDGPPSAELTDIDGGDATTPSTWTWTITGHGAGTLSMTFTADMGARTIASCQVRVAPGAPPADMGVPTDMGPPPPPSDNRFGIGLVSEGSEAQMELTANLTGPGGHVKMIFAGVAPGMTGPRESWSDGVQWAYDRQLVPVVRFGPDWGDLRVRNQSDPGSDGLQYTQLAQAYVAILEGLPIPAGATFYVEVHNEPNLCYEWLCDRGRFPDDRITYQRIAQEYAAMLRDVADAIHATGDPRYQVVNGGLAPGGVRWCECNGTSEGAFEAGITSKEFLQAMEAGVPGVFGKLDAFSSHSYPSSGIGYGFFVPYGEAGPGLRYFEMELATIGRTLPVLMTETGWPRTHGGTAYASESEQATWMRRAYENVWLTHPNIQAVMPFILQDPGNWDGFAWVDGSGNGRAVYGDIRSLRCATISERCP